MSTTIILDGSENYQQAETDVYATYPLPGRNVASQELVNQTFPQTLSEHYTNLKAVLGRLINLYSTNGSRIDQDLVHVYSEAIDLMSQVQGVITQHLSVYDKTIGSPTAVVTASLDDMVQSCQNVSLSAPSGFANAGMSGSFYSYYDITRQDDYIASGGSGYLQAPYYSGYFSVYIGNQNWDVNGYYDFAVTSGYFSGYSPSVSGNTVYFSFSGPQDGQFHWDADTVEFTHFGVVQPLELFFVWSDGGHPGTGSITTCSP
jgi:hypothetical protein